MFTESSPNVPSVCMEAPVLEVEEKKGLQKLFSVDGNLAALPRRAASFLQTRSALAWPPAFTSRFVVSVRLCACTTIVCLYV